MKHRRGFVVLVAAGLLLTGSIHVFGQEASDDKGLGAASIFFLEEVCPPGDRGSGGDGNRGAGGNNGRPLSDTNWVTKSGDTVIIIDPDAPEALPDTLPKTGGNPAARDGWLPT